MDSLPKEGILLYDESMSTMPTRRMSSMPSMSSDMAITLQEGDAVRTDYASPAWPNKSQRGAAYENLESPTSILETTKPNLDFGSRSTQFQPIFVLVGAVVGIGLGIGLYYSNITAQWTVLVALPGDLFVRALQCLIVPLVFCYMTIVVTETIALGDSPIIRLRNLLPFMASSLLSTTQGFCLALLFKNRFFAPEETSNADDLNPSSAILMKCSQGMMLGYASNGTLACVSTNATGFNGTFWMTNQTTAVAASSTSSLIEQLSLMEQIVGICNTIVPSNIFASMASGSLLSIVMFAIPFGYAMARTTHSDNLSVNPILTMLKQVRDIFLLMLNYLLKVTPFAVVFLMAGAIARFNTVELGKVLSEMGYLLLAFIIGIVCHALVVLPLFMYAITKANPFAYMRHLVPAFVFAFSCSSSMATLPVSIACIQRAKVNRSIAQIAMPFGTPVNLNAVGIYYPLVAMFMANMSDHGCDWTPVRLAILFLVSFLGCIGTAPVPNAGLVYTVTLWSTCFPGVALPKAFALVVSADVLMDRISTMVNVCGNAMVTRILAHFVQKTQAVQASHPAEERTEEECVDV
ncbi:hypothetical protein AC1031_017312 [Aphanomyces cochlioides]|nr:hypothetical protein AC1031_017312 [Aphanomyces cochlioides]